MHAISPHDPAGSSRGTTGAQTTATSGHGGALGGSGSPGLWGALAGLIVAAFIAVPLSAAFGFATHPQTQQLFAGRLSDATQGGYTAFWWIVTLMLLALPFLVGWGVARLSGRTIAIIAAVIALFVIAIVILGQLFVF